MCFNTYTKIKIFVKGSSTVVVNQPSVFSVWSLMIIKKITATTSYLDLCFQNIEQTEKNKKTNNILVSSYKCSARVTWYTRKKQTQCKYGVLQQCQYEPSVASNIWDNLQWFLRISDAKKSVKCIQGEPELKSWVDTSQTYYLSQV